jgi:dTDP-4-dehydrorhamnose reductase
VQVDLFGSYLIKEFRENGYSVIACDINKKDKFEKEQIYYDMDILDYNRVEEVLKECMPDYIVNLAAISSVRFILEYSSERLWK